MAGPSLISQKELPRLPSSEARAAELFPPVVRRGYDRARTTQRQFREAILESGLLLPDRACLCINGSVSRLESVRDSDIDYVLIWTDALGGIDSRMQAKSREVVNRINSVLGERKLRPCESFSCEKSIFELTSTENLFSRYCILTLIDSSFVAGDERSYSEFLRQIKNQLEAYAIGISAETLVIRTLMWYIQREGWIDQLHIGTSVNRFSRLIQLFTTILSIHQFGIEATRATRTTWLRIEKLEPFYPDEISQCLKKLWIKALELKEGRAEKPMLQDTGFIAVSQLMQIRKLLLELAETPIS